jgi:hypothetical protein
MTSVALGLWLALQVSSCPFSPAELSTALDLKVVAGKPSEVPFPGGKMVSCTYEQSGGFTTVTVTLTYAASAADLASMDRVVGSGLVAIKGDPDNARWQTNQYEENNVALHYTRGTVRTEIRVVGGRFKAAEMQPRLLKLRRVP